VSSKWLSEISEHCPGVKIVLCALKCDLREEQEKDDEAEEPAAPAATQRMIQYNEGLEVARKIGALRYLGKIHEAAEKTIAYKNQSALRCATEA
jgi:Rho family, other